LGVSDDFGREHLNVMAFASRLTQLSGVFIGPPVNNNWGANATFSHDFTRLMSGSITGIYTNFEELGGSASTYSIDGRLSYTLSELTNVYFSTEYLTRDSSATLQALSPLTRGYDDLRITIGLTHRFL
jgi:predicted porin